jgi:hypothetical protein
MPKGQGPMPMAIEREAYGARLITGSIHCRQEDGICAARATSRVDLADEAYSRNQDVTTYEYSTRPTSF